MSCGGRDTVHMFAACLARTLLPYWSYPKEAQDGSSDVSVANS